MAFARTMARRDPDDATVHLILSIAFEQESKNAWKTKDVVVIKSALYKALGEACTALRLDPRDPGTRLMVAGLQDKLVGLASEPTTLRP